MSTTQKKFKGEAASGPPLEEFLEKKQTFCLNQTAHQTLESILEPNPPLKACLKSDCDEQLLVVFGYRMPAKPVSISNLVAEKYFEKKSSPKINEAPKNIKIFTNQNNIDFGNVNDQTPVQAFVLSEKDYEKTEDSTFETELKLKVVHFGKVNHLVIFIVDNIGENEQTAVHRISCRGEPLKKSSKVDLTEE